MTFQFTRRGALLGGSALLAGCASMHVPLGLSNFGKASALVGAARDAGRQGQIYAWCNGQTLIDEGIGEGVTPASLVPWASACKPTTVTAVMRLVEAGEVKLDDRITKFIPTFGQNGKEEVTVWNLMTHTGALGGYDGPLNLPPWEESIAQIVAAPRVGGRGGALPALSEKRPSYNPAGIWILGEILHLVHNRPFEEVIRTEVYQLLRMDDSWNGMSAERAALYGSRIVRGGIRAPGAGLGGGDGEEGGRAAALGGRAGALAGRGNGAGVAVRAQQGARAGGSAVNPAGGGVGPVNQLALFYRMALGGGELNKVRLLKASTIAEMTRVQATDGGAWTFGLGFNINIAPTRQLSEAAERLRYGQHPSSQTFGHNGATGLIAFCDPKHKLIVVMIGVGTTVSDALYDDLRLS